MARFLDISHLRIADNNPPFIIAEIGHNHQGSLDLCKTMIKAAADAGASAVKLQKRSNKDQFTADAYNAVYNSTNSYGRTYGEHREFLEFSFDQYRELQGYCSDLDIIFFSTAFDFKSVDFLQKLDVPAIKIASGDCVNLPLLSYAAETHIPLIVSTGACSIDDVRTTHDLLTNLGASFALLQCTSGYPAQYDELNISVVSTYRESFPNTVIGFSSHENGITAPVAAFTLGARIIEKHFTTDRTLKGTDQAFSLSTNGMERMCRDLNRIHLALGDGIKRVYSSEFEPMKKQRKSIVAGCDIPSGTILTKDHFSFKCPNLGMPPSQLDLLVGKTLNKNVSTDYYITLQDVA